MYVYAYVGGRVRGLGLRQGSAQSPSVSSPTPRPPLSSRPPGWHSFPVLRPALCFRRPPIPARKERLALQGPCLLSASQMTPKGLLAKVCSLDFVFPRLLYPPRASWLWPQRQPLSVPANTSQLCAQTKPCVPVGAGPAEGTFPGNSGGGGWEGRGDCLIAGARRHRLGDLAGPQGPVAVGGGQERQPGWKKSAVGEGRKQAGRER